MEYIRRALYKNINPACFKWCLALPAAAFVIALTGAFVFYRPTEVSPVSAQGLKDFMAYYSTYKFEEFVEIFANNLLAAFVVVYFTPLALILRGLWEGFTGRATEVSALEKNLLYLFPGLFLIRQAVNIALASYGLASRIGENIVVTVAGIILPHGIPEFLVFFMVGAVGMEVTRKVLASFPGRAVSSYTLGLLVSAVAFCALVEVYITPKVFAVLMA